jgi:thymidylate synthase
MPLKKHSMSVPYPNELKAVYQFNGILNLVVAYTFNEQGIGYQGNLPWHIPEDMQHFKELTSSKILENPSDKHIKYRVEQISIVIMGHKTWDSISDKYKPLSNRFNIVLSTNKEYCEDSNKQYTCELETITNDNWHEGVYFSTWDNFFGQEQEYKLVLQIIRNRLEYLGLQTSWLNTLKYYIIGGEQIYKLALESDINLNILATEIYLQGYTGVNGFICDTFFPKFDNTNILAVSPFHKSNKTYNDMVILYRFITYYHFSKTKIISNNTNVTTYPHPEIAYLNLMQRILETGQSNNDRTNIGTLSVFGEMLKFDLRDTFPITTTKRLPLRMVFEELMLYISGKTDNSILQAKNIHIWDGNTSRNFLDKRGLKHYTEGDFGETYGFNMRHYGGEYNGCNVEYPLNGNYGYDQLANAINLIKHEPCSRRIIIDLWNPATQHKAALPSCLCKYQFNVNVDKKLLNLAIYLRSSDYFLANNWNTCTGALLVHMICNLEGVELTPGELTVFIADAHIYKSHIEQVKKNLERKPYPYPKLIVNGNYKNKKKDIIDFVWEDFELIGYKYHPGIKAEMAV